MEHEKPAWVTEADWQRNHLPAKRHRERYAALSRERGIAVSFEAASELAHGIDLTAAGRGAPAAQAYFDTI